MISIIVAMDENRVIGRRGEIPWRLRADLKRFKVITQGHPVIVGRKTHEAILERLGKPLPNRRTIVLTQNTGYSVPEGCEVAPSWEEALALVRDEREIFVIGGEEIYRLALPSAHRIFLTKVQTKIPDGDAFFPEFNWEEWERCTSGPYERDEKNNYPYQFFVLNRKEGRGT
ncbi:dihydrofolate reductase [Candidatus Parcubacteria bacterium]|nr:dihydrofolate reductase [Candidatus Parcubacteria bacterium]